MSRRYPADDVAVIWVQCSQEVLDQRCDARVDKMMEAGMLQEMIDFQKEFAQAAIEKDNPKYTNGIFQVCSLEAVAFCQPFRADICKPRGFATRLV